MSEPDDVPSPIDLRDARDAAEWAATANAKRPLRAEVFSRIARAIVDDAQASPRILELGSGPGFLAEVLLAEVHDVRLICLDFSAAMHDLARVRHRASTGSVAYVVRDFLRPDALEGLGEFDVVVTVQAVHELRHKRRAATLHRQVRSVLAAGGRYLVCDHVAREGMNPSLFMTLDEQRASLSDAGFSSVATLLVLDGLALLEAAVG